MLRKCLYIIQAYLGRPHIAFVEKRTKAGTKRKDRERYITQQTEYLTRWRPMSRARTTFLVRVHNNYKARISNNRRFSIKEENLFYSLFLKWMNANYGIYILIYILRIYLIMGIYIYNVCFNGKSLCCMTRFNYC